MKIKNLIILVVLSLFLSSCFIRSLNPFYTKSTTVSENRIVGVWKDQKSGSWNIYTLKGVIKKEEKVPQKEVIKKLPDGYSIDIKVKSAIKIDGYDKSPESEFKDLTNELKVHPDHVYVASYNKDKTSAHFLVIPFKVKNQLFLDFSPFINDFNNLNPLLKNHLVSSHSLVKLDINSKKEIALSWLDESKIEKLLKENKIKIKHQNFGVEGKSVLTASSEELQKFIAKYMNSSDKEKWKTDTKFILKK